MVFDRNEKKQVVALLGADSMGTAIVRRIVAGKKILLGDNGTDLLIDGEKKLKGAHEKATEIEHRLKERYGEETHVAIHVEPLEEKQG